MKKIYSFLFAATALFAAASCQKEVAPEVEAPKGEKITFTASTEVETKTALHENGKSTIWVAGDQISVFDANKGANNRCFNIDELSEDAKTATFSYEGEFVKDKTQTDPTVVALYPYQAKAYCDFFYYDRNYITGLNFPAEQTAVEGGFDSKAAFALGLGTMNTMELGFQNLYALLKFTVRDAGVKKVTVTVGGENAYIAGDAKIQMTLNTEKIGGSEPVFESPVLSIVENGSNTITLTCEEGFNTEATYYVAVVPTTFTGLSVFFDESETPVNTTEKTMTLEANKIYNLKDLGSPKQERGLAFEETKYDAILGNEFIAPELKGVTEDVVFSSSDEHVASVNPETGDVTLHDAGLVTIIAKAAESRYYKAGEASYKLNVTMPKVKVSRELSFSETSITIKLSDLFSAPKLTGYTDGVVYESNNMNVAVVDSKTGEVNVKGVGQATITASAEENDDYLAGSASYVLIVEEDPIIQLTRGLSFSQSNVIITYGEEFTAPELSGATDGVKYESSDTSVASVDPYTGEVSINGVGSATITASAPETPQYAADEARYTLTVEPNRTSWNLVGSIGTVNMNKSDVYTDLYVAKNVSLNSNKTFRFENQAGDQIVGAYGKENATVDCKDQINSWYDSDATSSYAANIKVSTEGNFDIYFSEKDKNFIIIKTDEEEVDSKWEIVGWINSKDSWGGNSGYTLKLNYITTELSITVDLTSSDYFKILKDKNWTAGTDGGWIGAPGYDGGTKDYTINVNATQTVDTYHSYDNHKAQFHMKNKGTYKIIVSVQDNPYTPATVKITRTK